MGKGHNYVPWREVEYWRCIRCGRCCREYLVPLTLGEAMNLMRKYGPVVIKKDHKLVLACKPNGDCIFLEWNNGVAYCTIYPERPHVCRMYPFYIRLKPLPGVSERKAEYLCEDGLKLYVYIDLLCKGVGSGYPVKLIVSRIVANWRDFAGI